MCGLARRSDFFVQPLPGNQHRVHVAWENDADSMLDLYCTHSRSEVMCLIPEHPD